MTKINDANIQASIEIKLSATIYLYEQNIVSLINIKGKKWIQKMSLSVRCIQISID